MRWTLPRMKIYENAPTNATARQLKAPVIPEQHRAEERQVDVFAYGVYARGPSTFLLREPGADDSAISGEAGRFGYTKPETAEQQEIQVGHEAL